MWLVAISLLHNSLHILWLQDLVELDGLDVVGEALLKDGEDLLAAALPTIHCPAEGLLKLSTELQQGSRSVNMLQWQTDCPVDPAAGADLAGRWVG